MDVFANYRENAKKTPFFAAPTLVCRCGQTPIYVDSSRYERPEGMTAAFVCINAKCGAFGLVFELEMTPMAGEVKFNAHI